MSEAALDLLAIAAHPDDVELRCGGLLARMVRLGHRAGILDLTEGEMGTRGTPEQRREEAQEAARVLGAAFRENLGLPDAGLEMRREWKEAVAVAIRRHRPRLVVTSYFTDSHPDHAYAGRLATEGAFLAGLRRATLPGEPWRPSAILYWPSHYDFRPSFVVDVTREHPIKMQAIRCFRSQLHQEGSDEPATNIASERFLARTEGLSRHYGEMIGVEHGEAYFVRQVLPVKDPVELLGGSDREWNGLAGMDPR